MKLSLLGWISVILVIVGGLNWGLVGALNFNLVDFIFGPMSILTRIVYIVVGIAAIYVIYMLFNKKA